jgi:O-antigen ligase
MLYIALPPGTLRASIKRFVLRVLPWIAVYMAIGWGRPESIFKPLRSLSSVTDRQDASTRSRDAENAGLIYTLMPSPATGIGFGREYTEVDTSLSARIFLQYRYQPHNSVLGLLAFTGFLGFAGIWMLWPVCVYLASRAIWHARDPTVRAFGLAIMTQLVACLNQMWGDMGFFSTTTLFTMATGFACATHLLSFEPALAGNTAVPRVVIKPPPELSGVQVPAVEARRAPAESSSDSLY